MREIKFRAWDSVGYMIESKNLTNRTLNDINNPINFTWMQFTGLKDKNGKTYIYEGDIIDIKGNVIGNKYENEDLLKEKTNFVIDGLCTGSWWKTYEEAMERGCQNAQ